MPSIRLEVLGHDAAIQPGRQHLDRVQQNLAVLLPYLSLWRSLEKAVFDGAFVATRCIEWCARLEMAHEMVKRSDLAGFVVLPKRWIVERNFAWLSQWNGLARDSVGRLDVAHRRFAAATAFAAAEALLNRLPASS